jgi:hypothetical protein
MAYTTDEHLLTWVGSAKSIYSNFYRPEQPPLCPFSIDVRIVKSVVWYNQGFTTKED